MLPSLQLALYLTPLVMHRHFPFIYKPIFLSTHLHLQEVAKFYEYINSKKGKTYLAPTEKESKIWVLLLTIFDCCQRKFMLTRASTWQWQSTWPGHMAVMWPSCVITLPSYVLSCVYHVAVTCLMLPSCHVAATWYPRENHVQSNFRRQSQTQ